METTWKRSSPVGKKANTSDQQTDGESGTRFLLALPGQQ